MTEDTAMRPEVLELLARGRQAGHVTWEELNAVVTPADGADTGALARLLESIEDAGVEILDAEAAAEPPQTPLTRDCPLAPALTAAGVPFTDLACRRWPDGGVFDACLAVVGADALSAWLRLRDLAPSIGYWPVIRGDAGGPTLADPAGHTGPPDSSDLRRFHDRAAAVVAEAANLTHDSPGFRHNRSAGRPRSDGSGEPVDDAPVGPVADPFASGEVFQGHIHPNFRRPFHHTRIDLLPTASPWEVVAYRPLGVPPSSPEPAEQLTVLRDWHRRYGVEVVSDVGRWCELHVLRPPTTPADAVRLARELVHFGEETVLVSGEGEFAKFHPRDYDLNRVARLARRSRYWYFWWDWPD